MPDIRLDYAVTSNARTNIETGANNISTSLSDMEASLRPLVEQWTGEASNAYHVSKQNWDEALTDMKDVLIRISNLLGDTEQQFSSTDRTGANRFGG